MLIVRKKSVQYNVIAFQMNENVFNCNNKNTTHISLYREWNKNKIDRKKNPNEKSIEMYGFFYQFVMSANCFFLQITDVLLSTILKTVFQINNLLVVVVGHVSVHFNISVYFVCLYTWGTGKVPNYVYFWKIHFFGTKKIIFQCDKRQFQFQMCSQAIFVAN